MSHLTGWMVFHLVVGALWWIDLRSHREPHDLSLKEASVWCVVWIGLALLFNAGIWIKMGPTPALEFLTAYLVEESLSVDNLFVMLLIFNYFRVPAKSQPRVLLWGLVGAMLMRLVFIVSGVALIH